MAAFVAMVEVGYYTDVAVSVGQPGLFFKVVGSHICDEGFASGGHAVIGCFIPPEIGSGWRGE